MYENIKKISSKELLNELIKNGYDFFSGVPDSVIRGIIRLIKERNYTYIDAPCEDVAVGVCVGASLSGKKPVILMQNSGLGNAADTIITLNKLYGIPTLFLITWRGYDGNDEIQHLDWGDVTKPFLKSIGLPYELIDKSNYKEKIKIATNHIENNKSFVILLRRGHINEER